MIKSMQARNRLRRSFGIMKSGSAKRRQLVRSAAMVRAMQARNRLRRIFGVMKSRSAKRREAATFARRNPQLYRGPRGGQITVGTAYRSLGYQNRFRSSWKRNIGKADYAGIGNKKRRF